jgi:hypothetical protein
MPTKQKSTPHRRVTPAARVRAELDTHRLDHITASLEATQKDVASIGGSVGAGVRDLRRDVTRLLRDAQRDLAKMRRAIERDLDRLQRDLTSAATGRPTGRRGTAPPTRTGQRRTAH